MPTTCTLPNPCGGRCMSSIYLYTVVHTIISCKILERSRIQSFKNILHYLILIETSLNVEVRFKNDKTSRFTDRKDHTCKKRLGSSLEHCTTEGMWYKIINYVANTPKLTGYRNMARERGKSFCRIVKPENTTML